MELNWSKTCEYIRENHLITNVSFETWMQPMKLVECSGECLIFEYNDAIVENPMFEYNDAPSESHKNAVEYIQKRYGQTILDAYNFCTGSDYKNITIK